MMRPYWMKLVRQCLITGVSLAVIGYLLGRGFLIAYRMNGGGAEIQENERVLWQTPLVMAVLGVSMTAVLSLLGVMIRRPSRTSGGSSPATETVRPIGA